MYILILILAILLSIVTSKQATYAFVTNYYKKDLNILDEKTHSSFFSNFIRFFSFCVILTILINISPSRLYVNYAILYTVICFNLTNLKSFFDIIPTNLLAFDTLFRLTIFWAVILF